MNSLKGVYKADSAVIDGNVAIGPESSVWHQAVLRGDGAGIVIGSQTNVQDGAVLHEDAGCPLNIGSRVTIGHRAIVHGCTVEDNVLIGMGAIVMNRARIGKGSIIGAGAVVLEGTEIPEGSIAVGSPARVIRKVSPEQADRAQKNALEYADLAKKALKCL